MTCRPRRACVAATAAVVALTVAPMALSPPSPAAAQSITASPGGTGTDPAADGAPPLVVPPHDDSEPPRTLMFTLRERMSIEAALREGGLNGDGNGVVLAPLKPRLNRPLYLSGLLYKAPGDWTIWINGQSMHPGDTGHLFSIADVNDRAVTLAVQWGETTRLVRLEPHQTFLPAFAVVIEGKAF